MAKNKTYGQSNFLSDSEKEKRTPKFLRSIFESPAKKSERVSTAAGKANKAATSKMYAAESMFDSAKKADKARKEGIAKAKSAISAAKRDEGKTKPRKTTPTTARDRAKTRIAPKGSIKDPRKALDAETRKSYEKRIAYMEKRKAEGKNYSKKNLAELKEKLK